MKNPKLKLVETAFARLDFLNNTSWTNHRERFVEICSEEERGHRGSLPEFNQCHTDDSVSVATAAKIFAVKRVAEYLGGARMPRGKDYLHTQRSCFYAAGLVDEYRREIRREWRGLDVKAIAALDYCEFVKVREDL